MRVQRARANRRLSAHPSATSAQKHITCLDIHCNACLRGTRTYCSSACRLSCAQAHRHLPHTITAMGIWAPPSRLPYAAENSHKHHQTLDIHADMKSHQRLPNAKWRNYEPEKRELRTGTSSTSVLSKPRQDGCVNAEATQCSTHGARFPCSAVVSRDIHPISVRKHTFRFYFAHVRRRE